MKGPHAFCPETGAPLTEERHYDEQGQAKRAPVPEATGPETCCSGALTNGERRSSVTALCNYFQRCHGQHRGPDDDLYRAAALAVRRLKDAASGQEAWDVYVWYALGERLARKGFDVDWMHAHVEPRCPDCHGPLKYEMVGEALVGTCATACTGHADRLATIRATVTRLYQHAFDPEEPLTSDDLRVVE